LILRQIVTSIHCNGVRNECSLVPARWRHRRLAGWLAGVLVKGGGFGLIGDLVVGIIGALIGGLFFSGLAGFAGGGLLGGILVATLGAVLLLVVLRVLKRA
jgi:uncharacterized membrane protein YeaQ/YmgE (transglycosylase-associated protein family)